ncbi:hypothetical protein TrVFT333_003935 [Trichoderma virens FT-333]|nr:hypothetical protein TrVFT333_003935 [Trichoderma virens FT-333]
MDSATRPMAPPPPPTRNPSTRRPQSLYGLESTHRRALAEIKPRDVVAPSTALKDTRQQPEQCGRTIRTGKPGLGKETEVICRRVW